MEYIKSLLESLSSELERLFEKVLNMLDSEDRQALLMVAN